VTVTRPADVVTAGPVAVPMVRRTAAVTVVALIVLVGTGGWVRLSASGLGCATWPKCFADDLMARTSYHDRHTCIIKTTRLVYSGVVSDVHRGVTHP
jgi:cytochrome c oxidase assembly protein subunit 15